TTAIVIPVITLKAIDINWTGKPAVYAVSSSNVKTYIGRLKRTYNTKTPIVIKSKNKTCSKEIVTIEPNKKLFKLIELPSLKLIRTKATAIPPDIKIAMEISE